MAILTHWRSDMLPQIAVLYNSDEEIFRWSSTTIERIFANTQLLTVYYETVSMKNRWHFDNI
jgi:hypothetical protein